MLRLPDRKIIVGETFTKQLTENYGHSLRRIAFLDCGVSRDSIAEICESCIHLEVLHVAIPMKELVSSFLLDRIDLITKCLAPVHHESIPLEDAAHDCRCRHTCRARRSKTSCFEKRQGDDCTVSQPAKNCHEPQDLDGEMISLVR